jgi:hypothetical protein
MIGGTVPLKELIGVKEMIPVTASPVNVPFPSTVSVNAEQFGEV